MNKNQSCLNTDREIWRQDLQDPLDPSNSYAPSVFVTADNLIGINSGGTVFVMTPEEWVKRAEYFNQRNCHVC